MLRVSLEGAIRIRIVMKVGISMLYSNNLTILRLSDATRTIKSSWRIIGLTPVS